MCVITHARIQAYEEINVDTFGNRDWMEYILRGHLVEFLKNKQ